jgi:hypothetical protein
MASLGYNPYRMIVMLILKKDTSTLATVQNNPPKINGFGPVTYSVAGLLSY